MNPLYVLLALGIAWSVFMTRAVEAADQRWGWPGWLAAYALGLALSIPAALAAVEVATRSALQR